ncbi:MAG: DUF1428 domain-containing protein [Polyangiales bacterium]
MTYMDGFVCAVPTAKRDVYRTHAAAMAAVFKECGALQVMEGWGDDVPEGELTSFPLAVQKKEDESVVFAWILWPSRAARDTGMSKAMEHSRFQAVMKDMPFDGKRMIYGGFETIVAA